MALRVLLADESSTIKKVMQLALQDYAVEVKSVPVGLDVLPVAKAFKPDIIFADVLLTKRNGYEVCADIKGDPEAAHIPVVLMWSGFMEIDEQKVKNSKADGRLEKPFDAEILRKLVNQLAPKTINNPISSYLDFPTMPDFQEEPQSTTSKKTSTGFPASLEVPSAESFDVELLPEVSEKEEVTSIDGLPSLTHEPEELELIELEHTPTQSMETPAPKSQKIEKVYDPDSFAMQSDEESDEEWAQQDLTKFKIKVPTEEDSFVQKFVIPQDELANIQIKFDGNDGDFEELKVESASKPQASQQKSIPKSPSSENLSVKSSSSLDMSPEMVEKLIREEVRDVIESICWKILPDIAERLVKEEIKKILNGNERGL
ncbi:MAG: response regulator [Bdellovibrionia bacterium]